MKKLILIGCLMVAYNLYAQRVYSVSAFGARKELPSNTQYLQRAIDEVHSMGGGKLVVPAGVYITGTLYLRSDVELHLSSGAVLRASIDPAHYPRAGNQHALVVGRDLKNVAVTGKGTLDGRGLAVVLVIDSLHHRGIRTDSAYNYRRMRPETRPMILNLFNCKHVKIRGITFKDSPFWVQNYTRCSNVDIDSITVNSVAFWNNDGIDISGSSNVRITHCNINASDDGICLKSESPDEVNDNIYIADCRIRSSASAIKFGTASVGAFRNITIENISVYDTYRSAIAIEAVDGATIENIQVRNVTAVNTGNALFIRLGARSKSGPVGIIRNVSIRNIKVQVPFERPDMAYDLRGPDLPFFHNPFPASITGIPGHLVENISLRDIEITYPGRATKGMGHVPVWRLSQVPERENEYPEFSMFGELPAWALYVRHVNGLSLHNITVKHDREDYRPAFVFDDVKRLKLEKITLPPKPGAVVLRAAALPQYDEALKKLTTIIPE